MFKKTWPFVICQSQERPVEVANKYYELTELDFEISCANEATWDDVVLVKQLEIMSWRLALKLCSSLDCKISGGASLSFVSCIVLDPHNSSSLCHGLSLEPLLNSCCDLSANSIFGNIHAGFI